MPSPLVDYLTVQRATDRQILDALRLSAASIDRELRRLQGRSGIGAAVRAEQLRMSQVAINRELARLWTNVGDITEAQKAVAAATAAEGVVRGADVLGSLFSAADRDYMARSAAATASRGLEAVERRLEGVSYVPLAQSVYDNTALAQGTVDGIVNAALARGASAVELARDVRAYVNPNTPGGVRYASMRLARTELNNSFHASQVKTAQESPWVTGVLWNLSGSHPVPDECNEYADSEHYAGGDPGVFRPQDVPSKPHPNCLCFTTTVDVDRDEFIRKFEAGDFDKYLADNFPDLPVEEAASKAATIPTTTQGKQTTPPKPFPQVSEDPRKAYTDLERARPGGRYGYQRSEALDSYKGYGYERINTALRGTADASARTKGFIRSLDSELKKGVPLPEDTTLVRGLTELADLESYKTGEYVVEAGYSSTTLSGDIADRFARGTLMGKGQGDGWVVEILAPKGTKTIVPGNAGGEEYEIILPRNSKFKVHAVDEGRRRIWLELVK